MKKIISLILFTLLLPVVSMAQEQATSTETESAPAEVRSGRLEVVPTIIDEKARARDILKYDIVLKNGTERYQSVYATVNDISVTEGKQDFIEPSMLNKETSLARWITISRGAKNVPPGGEISIPLEIHVDLTATPGKRYAVISFPTGSNRPQAEAKAGNGETPKLNINISVEEEIIERAQIKNFSTSKNFYIKFPVDFSVEIENFGNRKITPQGNIIIFNRRGEEVTSLDLNGSSEQIEPGIKNIVAKDWSDGRGFGKFKARLEIEYGSKDKRDLQDTIYFWVLPLPMLITFFIITFVLISIITVILFKKTYHHIPHHHEGGVPGKPVENNGVINLREK